MARTNRNLYTGTKDFSGDRWRCSAPASIDKPNPENIPNAWHKDGVIDGFTVLRRSMSWAGCSQRLWVEAGEIYTISMYAKTNALQNCYVTEWNGSTPTNVTRATYRMISGVTTPTVTNEFQRIWRTFEIKTSGYIQPGFERNNNDGTVWVYGYKLEKGSAPTPWTPAPEDLMKGDIDETPTIKPLNWGASMQQTFEYYKVDPGTWRDTERILTVTKSSLERDSEAETLGSASIEATESLGECYVRIYLITIQNGKREKHPLGTFLVQTPTTSYDGKNKKITMDAYTPLLELKENPPPLGYSILKNANVMDNVYTISREHMRGPVVKTTNSETLYNDFVANTDDTWLSFLIDLAANAKYYLDLDEMSRLIFMPEQDIESLQPVWTYTDNNSSILYPDISMDHDLYGVPNVVEVIYSGSGVVYNVRVENNDENSPTSIPNRGREIIYRDTDPSIAGLPTETQLREYATNLLKAKSTVEYTVTYSHGYCPVRINDCVRLNYSRAGMYGIKAKVIKQSIECDTGCKVTETAKFTAKLWEG